MRIYEGSPRTDFEEVLRSVGAFVDRRGMRDVLLLEAPDGFIVQGLVLSGGSSGSWSESMGAIEKETLTFLDEDIARFMDEAAARRGQASEPVRTGPAGRYEDAFRVIGAYFDQQRPRDVFFFEQDGSFVVRMQVAGQAGARHVIAEFTADDVAGLVATGPAQRRPAASSAQPSTQH